MKTASGERKIARIASALEWSAAARARERNAALGVAGRAGAKSQSSGKAAAAVESARANSPLAPPPPPNHHRPTAAASTAASLGEAAERN